jgi:DNA-binding response OmpR family regulator
MPAGYILVADDHEPISHFISQVLTDEGYTVRTALTAADARMAAKEQRPDLVLLDLYLPSQTGDLLARDLISDGLTGVPIIMMTASRSAASELSSRGIDFCLVKPFDLQDLLDCVAKHIRPTSVSAGHGGS